MGALYASNYLHVKDGKFRLPGPTNAHRNVTPVLSVGRRRRERTWSSRRRDLTPCPRGGKWKAGEHDAHRLFIAFLLPTLFASGAAVILSAVGAKDLLLAMKAQ